MTRSTVSKSAFLLLLVGLTLLAAMPELVSPVLGATDPCMATCCSRGWNFYGEGNFSKLGVNGTSDCDCFDAQLTTCTSHKDRIRLSALSRATSRVPHKGDEGFVKAAPTNHCLSACCTAGHAYYGTGDYARIDTCNCAMNVPTQCTS